MNETKLADLNNIRDFFNRVDSARNSVPPIEKPYSEPIGVKALSLCAINLKAAPRTMPTSLVRQCSL